MFLNSKRYRRVISYAEESCSAHSSDEDTPLSRRNIVAKKKQNKNDKNSAQVPKAEHKDDAEAQAPKAEQKDKDTKVMSNPPKVGINVENVLCQIKMWKEKAARVESLELYNQSLRALLESAREGERKALDEVAILKADNERLLAADESQALHAGAIECASA